jgi:hypothetical protein
MSGQIFCASCGEPIPDDCMNEALERRTPCAKCGSIVRNYRLNTESGHLTLTGSDVTLTVVRYPEILLQTAKRLFDNDEYAVAIVVAHTACEVAVERVISQSLAQSNISQIADPVDKLLNGYSLSNPKVRSLFDALTGKKVAVDKQNIWGKFCKSAIRRNRAVHAGEQPTRDEAEESLLVAREMVQYLVALIH